MIPKGTAIMPDRKVTEREPTIRGNIPKSAGSSVGYQYLPKIKSPRPMRSSIGAPSMKRNTTIKKRIVIEKSAIAKKMDCTPWSICFRLKG